jgi:hypothetical protein
MLFYGDNSFEARREYRSQNTLKGEKKVPTKHTKGTKKENHESTQISTK